MTENIRRSGLPHTSHAPVFLSLLAEGSAGGGYDVSIPLYPVPVFLQFKIPQIMHRRSKLMPPGFQRPYYRIHLRTRQPNQHELLRVLESQDNLVFYAAPEFDSVASLDHHFTLGQVPRRSVYFSPSAIGQLNGESHFIAYRQGSAVAWRFSEPVKLQSSIDAETFGERISAVVSAAPRQEALQFLNDLIDKLQSVESRFQTEELERVQEFPEDLGGISKKETGERPPPSPPPSDSRRRVVDAARRASYLAYVRLGGTMIITGRNN